MTYQIHFCEVPVLGKRNTNTKVGVGDQKSIGILLVMKALAADRNILMVRPLL